MKKKCRLVFILLLQNFYLNIYSETLNINKNINDVDKNLEKKRFPLTSIRGNLFFTFGGLKNNNHNNESINFTYENKIKIKTNFNENDRLITIIESPSGFFINPSNYYFEKDLHLNKEGNSLLSNKIIRYLKNDL